MPDAFTHSTSTASSAEKLLVDAREAARLLSISERKLWELTNRGIVKCCRIGRAVRYSRVALADFVSAQSL